MAMLEVDDLNVFYGNIHAIKDANLKVEKGEIVRDEKRGKYQDEN